tara:strand:- start:1065 stop:1250 length:186 start_codon:yes stop_codon:yes gene_type:complete
MISYNKYKKNQTLEQYTNQNLEETFGKTIKDIKKSFNIQNSSETEVYYSNRYGWTLRKTIL